MKIKIESDVFDIIERIKEIDDGYFVLYNTVKNVYELHNSNQPHTYCLTIPYREIDKKLIDLIYISSIVNIDTIVQDIDKNNNDIENNKYNIVKNQTDYMVREIFKFASNSSKNFDCQKSFENCWS